MDRLADLLARSAAPLAAGDDLDARSGAPRPGRGTLGSSFAAVTLQDPDRAASRSP